MTERDDLTEQVFHAPVVSFTERIAPISNNLMQTQVQRFHQAMGQPVGLSPRPLPQERVAVRVELIREEFIDELIPALASGDLIESIDAAVDILYVTFGLLVEMGVDVEPFFDEVQRSNMSKFGADGKPIIAGPNDPDGIFEGRVKKGPNYFKPDLAGVLRSLQEAHALGDEFGIGRPRYAGRAGGFED